MRKILAAGSVTAGTSVSIWKTPFVKSVVLPAHAQTSDPVNGGGGPGNGGGGPVISGQIGEPDVAGLLDLFLRSAYAAEEDLVGGCVEIMIVGSSVTVTVTLNTGASDTKSGTLTDCGFTVANVNGYTVVGTVDDQNNPTTCDGSVGSEDFSAVLNGSCSVVPPATTTDDCVPTESSACPT
ncbi:MAG: hypothetical protein WB783_01755 [Arenicellales bacterium]